MTRTASILLILLMGILFFFPFLGAVHLFDWDEVNFAESAREMVVTGEYTRVQIDFQPFEEKPPLFFWFQALSMHAFGVNEFAARFPNACFGVLTLLTAFLLGRRMHGAQFGLFWALAFLGSLLPHMYFKSAIIDPVFNYFIFMAAYFLIRAVATRGGAGSLLHAATAGVFAGLATLTKGPVGPLILMLTVGVFWISRRCKPVLTWKQLVFAICTMLLVSTFWYGWELYRSGPWFLKEFIAYQIDLFLNPVGGHEGPVYYHALVILFGCFPVSVLALPALIRWKRPAEDDMFSAWMRILFWCVLVLFSVVSTKIVHYSSMTYWPLCYLAARHVSDLIRERTVPRSWHLAILFVCGAVIAFAFIAVPLIGQFKDQLLPHIKDTFTAACLQTPVHWRGYEWISGAVYLAALPVSVVMLRRDRVRSGVAFLLAAGACCIFFFLATVVPKVEGYTQGPAIRFFKSLAGKTVYAAPLGYKSYAQYFYFDKPMPVNPRSSDIDWLLGGNIDKPAYFVARISSDDLFDRNPLLKRLYREGGFVFYRRLPGR
jgi:hypothetical protein